MPDKKVLNVPAAGAEGRRGLGRREAIQALVGGIGAGIAVPALADSHPVRHHLADSASLAEADAAASAADWKPSVLDAHQSETLASLGERIVPGSARANTHRFVDRLLSVDKPENVRKFLGSMGALEGEAIRRFGHPWKALAEPQQVELLTAASTGAPGEPDASGERRPTLRDHFDNLKGWIAGAYYSSEIGMRELGWTGNVFYESFPGCTHPGGHR